MQYLVKAECIDQRTGRRYQPGELFDPPPEEDQAERLFRAGCLRPISDDEAARLRGPIIRQPPGREPGGQDEGEAARKAAEEEAARKAAEEEAARKAAEEEAAGKAAEEEAAAPGPALDEGDKDGYGRGRGGR